MAKNGRPSSEHAIVSPALPTGDILQIYFREISQVALLTAKEEISLARRIRRGDKKAREHMTRANLRLVIKIVREYEGMGLPLLDLINEGNVGLMKSVSRFKPGKGAKLSTYASWWIRQAIRRALSNQSKTIRLPVHVVDRLGSIRKAEASLREQLEQDPSDEEIAAELGLGVAQIRTCREAARPPIPLEAPLGEGEVNTVADTIADANAIIPSDQLVKITDTQLLREVLATLKERERKILMLRFGLDNGEPKPLEVVGKHFGVTRERIRQIQEEALAKLRAKIERRNRINGHSVSKNGHGDFPRP